MSNGFVFGENNSSFVYDNRLDQLLSAMERMVSIQHEILEEIRNLRADLKDSNVSWRDHTNDEWRR
jgi:hypothetical protein